MLKLNRSLINSIKKDLKELNRSCMRINLTSGPVKCQSWRYPTLDCDGVEVARVLQDESLTTEHYILLLELIYDRLHYFLNLLLRFTDSFPKLSEMFQKPNNVICPRHLSVGALVNMYWQRMTALYNYTQQDQIDHKNTKKSPAKQDKNESSQQVDLGTQSDDCSLKSCESCQLSEKLVRSISKEIESACHECEVKSAILKERLSMAGEIFRISQWSAMEKWVMAISKDVTALTKEYINSKENFGNISVEMKLKEEKLQGKIRDQTQKLRILEDKIYNLEMKLKTEESQNLELLREKKNAVSEIQELTEKLEQTQHNLNKSDTSVQQLSTETKQLKTVLNLITNELGMKNVDSVLGIKTELREWNEKKTKEEDAKRDLERAVRRMEKELKQLQNNCNSQLQMRDEELQFLRNENNTLKFKILELDSRFTETEDLKAENCRLQKKINQAHDLIQTLKLQLTKLEREFNECKDREKLLLEYPDMTRRIHQKVHGDPQQDMEGQIQANQVRIKLLDEQNNKLMKTLSKMKDLPTKHRT